MLPFFQGHSKSARMSLSASWELRRYSVSKRLKDLGIRAALGVQRKEVLQAALGRAFKLLAIGSGVGLVLAWLHRRYWLAEQ